MANGLWGGRLPVGNLIATSLVFGAVKWRLQSQRVLNRFRSFFSGKTVQLMNDAATTDELRRWLDRGARKLNIGGGPKNLKGFLNIDFVRHANVEREIVANILDLAFVPSNSIEQIHSNHVVEHLSEGQLKGQLDDFWRVLRTEGLLTIRCPNALGVAYGLWFAPILESERDAFVGLGFPTDEDFGNPADTWGHRDLYGFLHWIYGDVGNIMNEHLTIITPSRLRKWLEDAGFSILKESQPESINLVIIARRVDKLPRDSEQVG